MKIKRQRKTQIMSKARVSKTRFQTTFAPTINEMEMEDLNNNDEIEFLTPQLVLSPNLEDDDDNNNNDDDDLVEVPETPMTQERDQKKKKKNESMIIICNGNDCTLSITESSLPCYDSHGNFYCPPCYYKSAIAELEKLQKEMLLAKHNVHLARNSLSLFINAIPPQPPSINPVEIVTEKHNVERGNVGVEELNVGVGNVVSTGNVDNNKKGSINVEAEVGETSRRTRSGKAKQVESQQHKSVDDSDEDFALLDRVFGQPQREDTEMVQNAENNVGCVRRSSRLKCDDKSYPFTRFRYQKSVVQEEDFELQEMSSFEEGTSSDETAPNGEKSEIVSGKSSKQYKVVKRSTNPAFPDSKRKRLAWTYEEEEMIMEGVRIFSQRGKQNLPWKSVLVHGAKVFDASRTPTDLKDKWKRMVKQASRQK